MRCITNRYHSTELFFDLKTLSMFFCARSKDFLRAIFAREEFGAAFWRAQAR